MPTQGVAGSLGCETPPHAGGAWAAVAMPTQGVAGSLGCETPPHAGDDCVGGVVGAGAAARSFFARPLQPPAGGGGGGGSDLFLAEEPDADAATKAVAAAGVAAPFATAI